MVIETSKRTRTVKDVWRALEDVMDPEIPIVSVVEMGIVRDVRVEGETVVVEMTPTFAGCPALEAIRVGIADKLRELGIENGQVRMVLSPPWTSDWIAESARAKLKTFGLAPPPMHGGNVALFFETEVTCPYCGSTNTRVTNNFGPTLCRAMYYCRNCQQGFEQFKAL